MNAHTDVPAATRIVVTLTPPGQGDHNAIAPLVVVEGHAFMRLIADRFGIVVGETNTWGKPTRGGNQTWGKPKGGAMTLPQGSYPADAKCGIAIRG
jgi:hypothetical protein